VTDARRRKRKPAARNAKQLAKRKRVSRELRRDGCGVVFDHCDCCKQVQVIDFDVLTDSEICGVYTQAERREESPDFAIVCECSDCEAIVCVIVELKGGGFKVSKANSQLQKGANYIGKKYPDGRPFKFTALVCRPRNARKSPFEERELGRARVSCKGGWSPLFCLIDGADVSGYLCDCAKLCA